jgi:hypothetical protein
MKKFAFVAVAVLSMSFASCRVENKPETTETPEVVESLNTPDDSLKLTNPEDSLTKAATEAPQQ